LLGIVSCVWLITSVPVPVLTFFGWYVVGGILLYFIYGMHNSELAKGHPVVADEEMPIFPPDADGPGGDHPQVRR
jgi:APA family basic amino acid/polyamine antiporter